MSGRQRSRPWKETDVDHGSCESGKALAHLRTVRGQIDGIIKMVEDDRYCIDVATQISASIALLKKANLVILKQHMNTCVVDAIQAKDGSGSGKIDEISMILEKYIG
jgi:CsoR family transcriptional regulator, copper-sensing transcriptional repressor